MHKNRIATVAIIIFLTLSMTNAVTFMPNAKAHTPALNIPTYAFINAAPNPAGVGQAVTVAFWLGLPPPTATGPYGDRWQGMMVKVTKPDGTTENLGPFSSDDTGGTYTLYTPASAGNYTFQMSYLGQTLAGKNPAPTQNSATAAYIGDNYQPSTSPTITVSVQSEPVPSIPYNMLPTGYWTRPIYAENNNWYSLGGNWLGLGQIFSGNTGNYNLTGNYNPYTLAPTTAHILWTKPELFGGTVGGEFGGSETGNYYTTSQYEPKFAPIILNGVLYYTDYPGSLSNPAGWVALDLRTGQTIWTENAPLTSTGAITAATSGITTGTCSILRCGQILDYVSPNQYGSLAYLWSTGTPVGINAAAGSTTYNMFDAATGSYVLSIVNGTTMFLTEDQGGDLIGYYTNTTNPNAPTFNEWNSTQCILVGTNGLASWQWRPTENAQIPFSLGIMWTIPMPTNISGATFPAPLALTSTGTITNIAFINSGVALLTSHPSIGSTSLYTTGFLIEAGFDTNTGALLWIINRTETPYSRVPVIGAGSGVYVEVNQETSSISGYSLTTGTQLWGPVTLPLTNAYDSVGSYQADIAKGVLYLCGFGGDIYAVNLTTGAIIWQTTTTAISGDAGSDTPYGTWPLWTQPIGAIADGILFVGEGHEYSPPLFRGAQQLAINITNGQPVWSILAFDVSVGGAISDGIMTTLNSYDNQIYGFGTGPTATTIEATNPATTIGVPEVIRGTITDISAGSKQNAVAANYPSGLPCVSDDSMTQWMEHVYMQQPLPTNTTGVQVTLSVIDSNNNYRNIGTTTSDASGTFGFNWMPDILGNYTLIATFPGTQSYYSSYAETFFYVSPAHETTPTPTTAASQSAADMYFVPAITGLFVLIIIVAIIMIVLMLRKRP